VDFFFMRPDLVIGLDSSTTATKAIAWDARGRAVAEGRASVPLSNPKHNWFEQDVEDWRGAAAKALKQLARKVDAARIAAVAISNQRESFAQFDAKDRPLRPGTLWLDERARAQIKTLSKRVGAETLHRISGKPPDLTPCIYRCAWFAETMPVLWKKTAKTSEVHGVLVHFLTGQWHTSTGSADPMGLLDMAKMDWSDELLSAASLTREQLPKLFRPGEIMGEVTASAAKVTGLKAGTPVVAGGGDGQCAGTGTNVFAKGRAYLNLGTAVVSGNFAETYAWNPAFRTMIAIAETGYIFETCQRTGTFLVNWAVEHLFGSGRQPLASLFGTLEREAAASPIGAHGLLLVPYWSGSMTPYWNADARGLIAGLTSSHRRGDVYRAILEGVTLEQVLITGKAAAVTEPIDHFVAIGGGAKSDLWCQIVADASGRPVKRLETVEASSLGAACAAAKGVGWFKTVPAAAAAMAGKPARIFRPRSKQHARYRELQAIYNSLWPTVEAWNARLAAFARGETA
jgi:sugar (pentulose or hexulose) kinase